MRAGDASLWWAIGTVIASIIAGYFGLRQAGKSAQPNAQEALNAGFTALTATQMQQVTTSGVKIAALEERLAKLEEKNDLLEDKIDEQARVINALASREARYQYALRRLLAHLESLRRLLAQAGLTLPPDPLDPHELAALLPDGEQNPQPLRGH